MKAFLQPSVFLTLFSLSSSIVASEMPQVNVHRRSDYARLEGDALDDPAIWLNKADPTQSLILGTDKDYGLMVFDLEGHLLQSLPVGRLDNVDVRYGFRLGARQVDLVASSNRSDNTVTFFYIDPVTKAVLELPEERFDPGVQAYGICLYQDVVTQKVQVFVTSKSGEVAQWQLHDVDGHIKPEAVQMFDVGNQVEGCVADDVLGVVYFAEEEHGIWRYPVSPDELNFKRLVDWVGPGGHLVADVEGLALYATEGDQGYLLVSSQGDNRYVVYERANNNRFVADFRIRDAASGWWVEETDGLEVISAFLGPELPQGILVVQDGNKRAQRQSFKMVDFREVLAILPPY